jgi:multidrug transporter EmrE-like cation transporter
VHPVNLRRAIRAAEQNLIPQRMPHDALDPSFQRARRDRCDVVDEPLCRNLDQLGRHIAADRHQVAAVDRKRRIQHPIFMSALIEHLLAALGITFSNLLIRRLAGEVDSVVAMGGQLLIGSLPLWLAAFSLERAQTTVWSLQFATALVALSLLGTGLAYWLWCAVLARVELNRANVFTFLVPPLGLVIGVLWFGEELDMPQLMGIGLTLGGVALVSRRH